MRYQTARYTAAVLTLIAGIIHGLYIQEHFEEWWGYGWFFLISTIAQLVYVPLILMPLGRFTRTVYWIGIIGNAAIVIMYLVTRTLGIPFFGPGAGEIEEASLLGIISVVAEILLIIALAVLDTKNRKNRLNLAGLHT